MILDLKINRTVFYSSIFFRAIRPCNFRAETRKQQKMTNNFESGLNNENG